MVFTKILSLLRMSPYASITVCFLALVTGCSSGNKVSDAVIPDIPRTSAPIPAPAVSNDQIGVSLFVSNMGEIKYSTASLMANGREVANSKVSSTGFSSLSYKPPLALSSSDEAILVQVVLRGQGPELIIYRESFSRSEIGSGEASSISLHVEDFDAMIVVKMPNLSSALGYDPPVETKSMGVKPTGYQLASSPTAHKVLIVQFPQTNTSELVANLSSGNPVGPGSELMWINSVIVKRQSVVETIIQLNPPNNTAVRLPSVSPIGISLPAGSLLAEGSYYLNSKATIKLAQSPSTFGQLSRSKSWYLVLDPELMLSHRFRDDVEVLSTLAEILVWSLPSPESSLSIVENIQDLALSFVELVDANDLVSAQNILAELYAPCNALSLMIKRNLSTDMPEFHRFEQFTVLFGRYSGKGGSRLIDSEILRPTDAYDVALRYSSLLNEVDAEGFSLDLNKLGTWEIFHLSENNGQWSGSKLGFQVISKAP